MNKKFKNIAYTLITLATVLTLASAVPAFAADYQKGMMGNVNRPIMKPVVYGVVTAISGNIITINGKQELNLKANSTASTTFIVDATNAKVIKNNATSTISGILVGDTIRVQGTITGTNVIATVIHDGVGARGLGNIRINDIGTSTFKGTGEPVVAGTVSAINGNSLSITNKGNVSYVVDTTNAKITQGQNTITISNVAVGDMVYVQGTVNGSAVIATSVIDQGKGGAGAGMMRWNNGDQENNNKQNTPQIRKGFFGGMGAWFSQMFGF